MILINFPTCRFATATTGIGKLNVGGTVQTTQAILAPGSATGLRGTVAQSWRITGLTAGTYTFKLVFSATVANMMRANTTHTTLSIQQVRGRSEF